MGSVRNEERTCVQEDESKSLFNNSNKKSREKTLCDSVAQLGHIDLRIAIQRR